MEGGNIEFSSFIDVVSVWHEEEAERVDSAQVVTEESFKRSHESQDERELETAGINRNKQCGGWACGQQMRVAI